MADYSPNRSIVELMQIEKTYSITANNSADVTNQTIAIYVGVGGDLKIDDINGNTVTLKNLLSGVWHPIRVKRVYSTGTTCTDIVGAY